MLTPERIEELATQHLKAFAQFVGGGEVVVEGEEEFAAAVWTEAQAATLATVTPLVQQMMEALETCRVHPRDEGGLEWAFSDNDVNQAKTAARAFLSGATKGEPS